MAPSRSARSPGDTPYHETGTGRRSGVRVFNGVERVRHELLTALHFGKLAPGDRVPSVRRLAELTGMNRKTVHRAYRRLADEGVLRLRPGSGTFISDSLTGRDDEASVADLLVAANRCRATAESLGVRAEDLAAFLQIYLGGRFDDVSLAVAECNHEQLKLLEQGLHGELGVRTRPFLISELAARPAAVVHGMHGVVTTDCHSSEVAEIVAPLGVPVYRVALDAKFPQRLLERAGEGSVIVLVADTRFAGVFRRLLRQMTGSRSILERVHIIEPSQLDEIATRITGRTWVYVSPRVRRIPELHLPRHFRRVRVEWRLDPGSLDRLRARLSLDMVSGGGRPQRRIAG